MMNSLERVPQQGSFSHDEVSGVRRRPTTREMTREEMKMLAGATSEGSVLSSQGVESVSQYESRRTPEERKADAEEMYQMLKPRSQDEMFKQAFLEMQTEERERKKMLEALKRESG